MLQTASADAKAADPRRNSVAAERPNVRSAPPAMTSGNQAMLRLQRKCSCRGTSDCGCDAGEKKEDTTTLHRYASGGRTQGGGIPPIVHDVLRSPGRTLDPNMRTFFESRFGRDFGAVRVHTDSRAAESARAVEAQAYTVGGSVVFGSGQYQPRTPEGQRLLAHELTHVVQQDRADAPRPTRISSPGEPAELEADSVAEAVTSKGASGIGGSVTERSPRAILRAPGPPAAAPAAPAPAAPAPAAPAAPTPAAPPATVPSPGVDDFKIKGVRPSTTSNLFFEQNSSALPADATAQIAAIKAAPPGTVKLFGFSSADEVATVAQARADVVKAALTAAPNPVAVASAVGDATAQVGQSDFPSVRKVEIAAGAASPSTVNCSEKDGAGNLVHPPKQPCATMDAPTETSFKDALKIANDAMTKATAAVAGTPNVNDAAVIDQFFGNHDPGTVSTLNTNLGNLQKHVSGLPGITSCGGQCDSGNCNDGTTIAYNDDVDAKSTMTLCVPKFKSLSSDNDRARNLVHESAHGTSPLGGGPNKGTADVAYRHERMLFQLSPADRLRNSDSYALFALFLREKQNTGKPDAVPAGISKPVSDNTSGFTRPGELSAVQLAIAQLEKRLTWVTQWMGQLYGDIVDIQAGRQTWAGAAMEDAMKEAAARFPLTAPPAKPTVTDETREAGILDRYKRMRLGVKRNLTITKMAAGVVLWGGAPAAPAAPVAGDSLQIGPDFFRATAPDQISLLLEQLAKVTPDVEAAFIPAYVSLAAWIHSKNP